MTARSPRGLLVAAGFSVLLFTAACRDEPKIVVTKVGGATVEVGPAGAVVEEAADEKTLSLPTDLPAFAPAYPGARLTTRIQGNGIGDGKGALFVFETPDQVEKVSAYYDARAREAGARATVEVTEADSAVRIYGGGADGKADGAMIAISGSDEGPGTEIVITSGMPKAEVVRLEEKPDEWRRAVRMPVRLQ
jgi:hypothetical protein